MQCTQFFGPGPEYGNLVLLLHVHPDILKQLTLNKSFLIYRVTECWEGEIRVACFEFQDSTMTATAMVENVCSEQWVVVTVR